MENKQQFEYPFINFKEPIEFNNRTDTYNLTIRSIIGNNYAKIDDLYIYLYRNDEKVLEFSESGWLDYAYNEDKEILDMTYNDTDLDELISVGDVISVKGCESGLTYKLELDYLEDYLCAEIYWIAE